RPWAVRTRPSGARTDPATNAATRGRHAEGRRFPVPLEGDWWQEPCAGGLGLPRARALSATSALSTTNALSATSALSATCALSATSALSATNALSATSALSAASALSVRRESAVLSGGEGADHRVGEQAAAAGEADASLPGGGQVDEALGDEPGHRLPAILRHAAGAGRQLQPLDQPHPEHHPLELPGLG